MPGKPTPADVDLTPRQVDDFATLFQENCAGCHGVDGRGNGALSLANPVYLAIANDETLRRVIAGGVPGSLMPPFARNAGGWLTDKQIDILVNGIRSHWAKPGILEGATPPPYADAAAANPKRGAAVYSTFCVSCHGPGGKGTEKIGAIVDGSFLALVSNQSLRTTIIAGRPDLGHPDWRHCIPNRQLTAQEVSDVVAWLVSRRPTTPGQPYPAAANL